MQNTNSETAFPTQIAGLFTRAMALIPSTTPSVILMDETPASTAKPVVVSAEKASKQADSWFVEFSFEPSQLPAISLTMMSLLKPVRRGIYCAVCRYLALKDRIMCVATPSAISRKS